MDIIITRYIYIDHIWATERKYLCWQEGEVGYPVCVPVRVEPANTLCHIEVSSSREQQADTEPAECGQVAVERSGLQEPTLEEKRRSSINIYQAQSKPLNHPWHQAGSHKVSSAK